MTESTFTIEDISETQINVFLNEDDGIKVTHRKKNYSKNSNPAINTNGLSNKNDYTTQRSKLDGTESAPSPLIKNDVLKKDNRNYVTPIDDFPRTPVPPGRFLLENKSPSNELNNRNNHATPRSNSSVPGSAPSPPIKINAIKENSRKNVTPVDDFPRTPVPSGTLSLENKSPFKQFPHSPQDQTSSHEEVLRKYLSATNKSHDKEKNASQEIPHLTRKNFSTVNAILKEMYLTTSTDFPSLEHALPMKDVSETNYQAPGRDQKCKPCFAKEKKSVEPKSSRDTCSPQNCDKLNLTGTKKWKTCCYEEHCSVNDPTSSTYNFLLKVRMCCRTKGCQLASKICDIYEPLVEIETNLDDIGEKKYHYLATDESTYMYSKENEELQEPDESAFGIRKEPDEPASDLSKEQEEGLSLLANESEYEITLPDEDIRESVYVDPGDIGSDSKRESTVSWSMPRDYEPQGSTSQEQVISRATAEADKFRQTPTPVRHGSVFGDIVQKGIQEPEEINTYRPSAVLFKSRIDNMSPNDSRHKQKCCPSLKEKFKKKKKKKKSVKVDDSEITAWDVSADHERRKSNRSPVPVEEKTEQINTMLNKV